MKQAYELEVEFTVSKRLVVEDVESADEAMDKAFDIMETEMVSVYPEDIVSYEVIDVWPEEENYIYKN